MKLIDYLQTNCGYTDDFVHFHFREVLLYWYSPKYNLDSMVSLLWLKAIEIVKTFLGSPDVLGSPNPITNHSSSITISCKNSAMVRSSSLIGTLPCLMIQLPLLFQNYHECVYGQCEDQSLVHFEQEHIPQHLVIVAKSHSLSAQSIDIRSFN